MAARFSIIEFLLTLITLLLTPGIGWAAPVDILEGNDFNPPDTSRAILGFVADSAGHPLPGVRLFIDGHGEVATGGDGRFILRGVAPGITYGFRAQRTGVEFDEPVATGVIGDFVTMSASFVPSAPAGCTVRDHAARLAIAAQTANRFRQETLVMARRIPAKQKLRLLSGEIIPAAQLSGRVEQQYARYAAFSRQLPEREFACSAEVSCQENDLRTAKLIMSIELDNLSHERFLANRVLVQRGIVQNSQKKPLRRTVISLRNRARKSIEMVRSYASLCSGE